ncbi:MAG: hypothetical protein U1E87_10090 [Alphaproteobacteria bacterium]
MALRRSDVRPTPSPTARPAPRRLLALAKPGDRILIMGARDGTLPISRAISSPASRGGAGARRRLDRVLRPQREKRSDTAIVPGLPGQRLPP